MVIPFRLPRSRPARWRLVRAAGSAVLALVSAALAVVPDLTGGFAAYPSRRQLALLIPYCVVVVLLAGTAFKITCLLPPGNGVRVEPLPRSWFIPCG